MSARRTLPAPWLVLAFFVLGLFGLASHGIGCSDSDSPTKITHPPDAPDRSTPQAVLQRLREAWVNLEADDYDLLLAADFTFYFSEDDYTIGYSYTRQQEMEAFQGMCNSPNVDKIILSFVLSEPSLDQNKPDPERPGEFLRTVLMTNTRLELFTQNFTYLLENAVERFWFREETPEVPGTSDAIWKIVEWKEVDQPHPGATGCAAGGGSIKNTTWGSIKSMFK